MKTPRHIGPWAAAIAACWLASTAAAQPEQWLQYKTGAGSSGYTWIEPSTNPPPNLALPKLNASLPYFGRWVTPLDPSGGRWLCLDRSRKSGPYDRLYIDRKGTGRLDDEAPVAATRPEENSTAFDAVKLVFKGEDGPVTYHLSLRFLKYEDGQVNLLAEPACWYQGTVTLAGKKVPLKLYDGNVNGVFNDLSAKAREGDLIQVGETKEDDAGTRALGRLLEWEGQYYALEVARDGAFVKIRKAEGLTFGQVQVPKTISGLTAVGENGQFQRRPTNGLFNLPSGSYSVRFWDINRKDAKGAAWTLSGYDYSGAIGFEAGANELASLEVGEPLRAALQASESKGSVSFSLRLQGRYGESVQIMRGSERPRAPQLLLAARDGSYHSTNTFEYG
jgi:hypothetical protein